MSGTDGMDFTELVRRKIEERREGRSAAVQIAAAADARFQARVAPLRAALVAMVSMLSRDAMFARAFGRPEVTLKRDDTEGREGMLRFEGPAGIVCFNVHARDIVGIRIFPCFAVAAALDCGGSYSADPVPGSLSGIDDLIGRARDHLSDFLADIYLSPAVHVVQSAPQSSPDGDAE